MDDSENSQITKDFPTKHRQRSRSSNWSEQEQAVLREQCLKFNEIIHGTVTQTLTSQKKTKTWLVVMDKVNAVGGCNRNLTEVKKKWTNMRANSAKTVRQYNTYLKGTGNMFDLILF